MGKKRPRIAAFRVLAALLLAAAVGAGAPSTAKAKPGYLRTPDVHGDRIVFSAEGDLWVCRTSGQDVRRITSHVGLESSPRFSPDGRWIAFTGDYDGNRDVFLMPAEGGEPRRMTWHPSPDYCLGWTPDGDQLIVLSWRGSPNRSPDSYLLPVSGGEPVKIPIGRTYFLDIDKESGRYAFTRSAGGGIWKRYRGGTAADIWVGDPGRADFQKVTDFEGADMRPMWAGGRIYFLCDFGGTMNIWSMNPDGTDRRSHTRLDRWDAREAAIGPDGQIVFTLAGDIHLFDVASKEERLVPIDLPSERILTRKRYPEATKYITWYTPSPDGDRVGLVTRGEIFSIPVEEGVTLPITHGSGARERRPNYDPEGKRFAYITDESGEEEIVIADAWGRGDRKSVNTASESKWFFPPLWSPDGKWLAYSDENQDLYVVEVDGGSPRKADHAAHGEIRDYVWSPDGRWIAYSKENEIEIGSIFIYDTKEDEVHQVTSWTTDDRQPEWDLEGRYLYFLSDRTMNPLIGWRDFETVEFMTTKPYMILLRPDVENPFLDKEGVPPGDEEEEDEGKGENDEEDGKKDGKGSDKPEPVDIDFTGLAERYVPFPVPAGRYFGLDAAKGKVFYFSLPVKGMARDIDFEDKKEGDATLIAFDLEEKEAETFVSGVSSFEVAANGEKVAFMKGPGNLYVVGTASAPSDFSESKVSLSDVNVELHPLDEWRQIFLEGWRNMRDFYWDEGMHGVDWAAIRDQYAELLPRLATRDDLGDLMAEMIGELATSHTYVWGGDQGKDVPRVSTGTLGADVERSGDFFRVTRIYRADPADCVRSPLDEPGVNVQEGDYILSVNGLPFPGDEPFEASLENLAGQQVLLTVNDEPSMDDARNVVVTPLGRKGSTGLIYADWVRRNREYVAGKTEGRIGYMHVPDMSGRGLAAFDRWFYPQLEKEGMVIDMRWNGGGFVSQLIFNRLARTPVMFGRSRGGSTWTWPDKLLNGPFVVLTNEFAGSDGDLGPNGIQLAGLAPIIGKRSWGGVVGIRGDKPLVDGGMETQPEFAYWDPVKGWGLENRGVEPDIEVENMPQDIGRGIDAQLDRGIEEVLRLRAEKPPVKPNFEPAPDRSRGAYERREK